MRIHNTFVLLCLLFKFNMLRWEDTTGLHIRSEITAKTALTDKSVTDILYSDNRINVNSVIVLMMKQRYFELK